MTILNAPPVLGCESAAPWSKIADSAQRFIEPLPLVLSGAAVAAPLAMSPTGADHQIRLLSQRDIGGKPNAEPVSIWTPFVLPVVLVGVDSVAHVVGSCEIARPTSAMLQAMGGTFIAVTGLKWLTGRSWPNGGRDPNASDRLNHPEFARTYHWFSWSHGTAWPSGHSATMFAAATALTTVTRGRSWLGYVAIAAATGVATGMWLGDHHWGSDIVSGSLFGIAWGQSVGLAFRDGSTPDSAWAVSVVPWTTSDVQGLRLAATW